MRILVTGASGFVGAMLIPRLSAAGHEVRAMARDPQRARRALAEQRRCDAATRAGPGAGGADGGEPTGIEIVQADALCRSDLDRALDGVEVAYYLIHSMGGQPAPEDRRAQPARGGAFDDRERRAAERFVAASSAAGVRRVVYLGGLVPEAFSPSRHLASRREVETIVLQAIPDSLALRASIVIGARSRSFRLLVRLVEQLPVLALPPWRHYRTQPIDARDVAAMLVAAASRSQRGGEVLEIAGPEALSYEEMLTAIADCMLVGRARVPIPVRATQLTARVVAAITAEDPELTVSLMAALRGDLLPGGAPVEVAARFGVRLHGFGAAVEHALREWEAIEPLAAR